MRNMASGLVFVLLGVCAAAARAGETPAPAAPARVAIAGELAHPLQLDLAAAAKLPRTRVEASDHGTKGVWEGVKLAELLAQAGAPLGEKLRGANLAGYVVVSATDGYRAVFALAEFDAAFGPATAILADTRDGKPLDAREGPFRIVAPDEKRPGRWVRQVERIEVHFAAPSGAGTETAGEHRHAE